MGQDVLEPEHETRGLTTEGDVCQRFESLAGVGGQPAIDAVVAVVVEGEALSLARGMPFGSGSHLEVHAGASNSTPKPKKKPLIRMTSPLDTPERTAATTKATM